MAVARGSKRVAAPDRSDKVAKAKIDKEPSGKYACVRTALMTAPGTTADLGKLLDAIIPLSLGVSQDERHPFQTRIVDTVCGKLDDITARLKDDISEVERQIKDAEALKQQHTISRSTTEGELSQKQTALADAKASLAQAMSKFRDMREALEHSEASHRDFEARHAAMSQKLSHAHMAVNGWLQPLKCASSLSAAEMSNNSNQLLLFLQSGGVALDESLMTALPAALEKAPESRGAFDAMTIQEVESRMATCIAAMEEALQSVGPKRTEFEVEVNTAKSGTDEAAAVLREAAASYRILQDDESKLLSLVADSNRSVKDSEKGLRRLTSVLDKANMKLTKFRDGPFSVFHELRDQKTAAHSADGAKQGPAIDTSLPSVQESTFAPAEAVPDEHITADTSTD